MIRLHLCLLPFCILLTLSVTGQKIDSAFIEYTIQSQAFGDERRITVHLPSRYLENPNEPMMVTYALDGQGPQYFGNLVATLDYLTSRYRIIPTIVVGLHAKDRFTEFTPQARPGAAQEWERDFEGQLPNLQAHLAEEVFPLIDSMYNPLPFRAIVGHSRGGSFVIQTLFDGHHDLFDAYLAISPAINFDKNQSIDLAGQVMSRDKPQNKFLYCSSGDVTAQETFFQGLVEQLDSVMQANSHPGVIYHKKLFAGYDHFTNVSPAIVDGMVLLKNELSASFEKLADFEQDKSKNIIAHIEDYAVKRKSAGWFFYEHPPLYYRRYASDCFDKKNYVNAFQVFHWVHQKEPLHQWWEVLNMGVSGYHIGELDLAEQYCAQALVMLEGKREELGDRYEEVKKSVLEQIREASR